MRDTKTRILDAAESLLVELGAHKASLRKITRRAGVNIAAINYHFGSKNAMISAIIERLLRPLVEDMKSRLDRIMEGYGDRQPEVAPIVRCFLTSLLNYSEAYPDHKKVFMQVFQTYDDDETFKDTIRAITEPEIRYLGRCLVRALPELPESVARVRIAFFRNTAFGIMKGDCIMDTSVDVLGITMDRREMLEEMVWYISAGLKADHRQ